jgi:hypothetical protein
LAALATRNLTARFGGKPLQLLESVTIPTTSTTKIATTATAARTLLTRPRDIDREGATGQFLGIQRINGFLRFRRRAHGNEPKSTGTSRCAVHHQVTEHGKLLLMAPAKDRAATLGLRCAMDAE